MALSKEIINFLTIAETQKWSDRVVTLRAAADYVDEFISDPVLAYLLRYMAAMKRFPEVQIHVETILSQPFRKARAAREFYTNLSKQRRIPSEPYQVREALTKFLLEQEKNHYAKYGVKKKKKKTYDVRFVSYLEFHMCGNYFFAPNHRVVSYFANWTDCINSLKKAILPIYYTLYSLNDFSDLKKKKPK